MTEAVNLLSDVGQRFTDVHLRLLSLQTAYEVSEVFMPFLFLSQHVSTYA